MFDSCAMGKLAGKETKEIFLGNENFLQCPHLDEGVVTQADRFIINSLTYTINIYAVHCKKNLLQ